MTALHSTAMPTGASAAAPLRVALVTETFPPELNGVAMTAGRVVNGLQALGHRLRIVRPRQPDEDAARLASFADLPTTLVSGIGVPGYNGIRFGLPAKSTLRHLWQSERPDVVHILTEGPLGRSALQAATGLQLPVVAGYHTHFDRYTEHYRLGFLRPAVEGYLRRFHNRCQINLAPTRELVAQLSDMGMHNLRLMSRGIDRQQFNPQQRNIRLRAEWGAGADDLVMLCVGRLAAEKNLDLVVQAWQAVRRERPYTKLVLVGSGPEYARLARLDPDIILTGAVSSDQLGMHYASADLFVFASMSETFGNVVQEAMVSGLPVIGFDYAAARELITDGHNGLLVSFGNVPDFIARTVMASRAPQTLRAMGAAASQSGRSWQSVTDELVCNYRDAIALAAATIRRPLHAAPARNA
ncbi:glycosyltransferase family 4 protein [Corticibacter populi]|nr:glycosyltransferase family 1 protein [Corticibacter populi]